MSRSIHIITFIFFLLIIPCTAKAQSLSSLASILNNIKNKVDTTFHLSSLSSIVATPISDNTYFSSLTKNNTDMFHSPQQNTHSQAYNNNQYQFEVSINTSAVASNLWYLMTTTNRFDEVLTKEMIGASTTIQMRLKPWTPPLTLGFHLGNLALRFDSMQLRWYSMGAHVHYTILKQNNTWQPTFSTMLLYAYSFFGIYYPLSTVEIQGIDNLDSDFRVKLDTPALQFDANIHSIAWRVIIHKTWNSITPFLLLEPALYISDVSTVTDGIIYLSEDKGKTYTKETSLKAIASNFLNRNGLNDSQSSIKGSLQLIGGTQFAIGATQMTFQIGFDFISFYSTFGISLQL